MSSSTVPFPSNFSLLCYDIPKKTGFVNPSDELRPIALRFQWSCWIVSNDAVPYPLIAAMKEAGCVVDLYPQHTYCFQGMCQRALRALEEDVEKRVAAERKTVEEADRKFDAVCANPESSWDDRQKALKVRDRARELAAATTERYVQDWEHALRMYGQSFDLSHFSQARARVNAIRSLQGRRADEYVKMVEQMREQGGQSAGYAAVAQSGGVPAEVLMDMAEEAGVDVSSAREAFSPTATALAAPETLPAPVVTRTTPQPAPTPPAASQVPQNGSGYPRPDLSYLVPEYHPAQPTPAPAGSHAPRRFEVRNRNGFRARVSTYTDREAALILREANDTFARSLARQVLNTHRPLTETQRAWLHVLAVELETE